MEALSFSFEGEPIAVAIEKRLIEVERIRDQVSKNKKEISGKVSCLRPEVERRRGSGSGAILL